jgi:2-polyprenyl-6-methoxyphenol hydroxylase-like FAD-dependent oxidoreductase
MTLSTVPHYDPSRVPTVGEHAVVAGAGMGGLLAARVLADAFEEVTLLERDPLPSEPTARTGVPQANHAHAMLEAGRDTLKKLFPGYCDAVRSAGGLTIDMATKFDYYYRGAFLADGERELPMLCGSRPLLEQIARDRVAGREGVTLRQECRLVDYLADEAETTIDGVALSNERESREELPADLVVDTTGRSSRTPRWLERHGYRSPPVSEVEIDLAYSTTVVERPPDARHGLLIAPAPDRPRGAACIPIENDRWIVTLFGLHGDHPPTDADGFRTFAESLPTPELGELLADRPLAAEEIHHYPFPSNRWCHYERLERFPDGLVVLGDAVASFNPIYGQGMSVAALDALQLHHALAADGETDLAARVFDRIADVVGIIWRITVGADFEFPQTTGPKPPGTDLSNRYLSRVIRTAYTDGQVSDAFARVHRLERHPKTLFRPSIFARVALPERLKGYL